MLTTKLDAARALADVHIKARVGGHAACVDLGGVGRRAILRIALRACAGVGGDDAAEVDLADAIVEGIGDVQIADDVYGDVLRPVELRGRGRDAVAVVACLPVESGNGLQVVILARPDLVHHAILRIGDVQVAARVEDQPLRMEL